MARRPLTLTLCVAALLAAMIGCDQQPSQSQVEVPEEPQARIVTLAPALTQMLIDLDHADLIVGVADNDNAAPPGVLTVGNITSLNTEKLLQLEPTHVLAMSTQDGLPPQLADLARSQNFKLVTFPSPKNIYETSLILIHEDDMSDAPGAEVRSLAGVLDSRADKQNAQMLMLRMMTSLAKLTQLTDGSNKPSVLLVIGTDPLMASGPGTVLNELLLLVNATNAVWDATVEAPVLDKEKLLEARPEVVVFLLPKEPPLGDVASDPRLAMFKDLDIPAVKNSRLVLINDPLVHLPSTSLPRIAGKLAKAIHPQLSEKIDLAMSQDPLKPVSTEPHDQQPADQPDEPGQPSS